MRENPRKSVALGLLSLRALAWTGASAALLAGGLYALGAGLVAASTLRNGTSLGPVQVAAWHALYMAVFAGALLPHGLLTLVTWLVVAQLAPRFERSWRWLFPGTVLVAALCFPLVGHFFFHAWKPGGVADVLHTWLLMTGAVVAALLLPRALLPPLAPGAFAGASGRSKVEGA